MKILLILIILINTTLPAYSATIKVIDALSTQQKRVMKNILACRRNKQNMPGVIAAATRGNK